MTQVLHEIRHNKLLWLLIFVPVLFASEHALADTPTALFLLSVLAIIPLAALLARATESVAAQIGDALGGLLNATLGNLTELVIAITALSAGQYTLVKASIAGAIVTNTLFMLGGSFLLGGLRHHAQEFNKSGTRLQSMLLFLAVIALLIPSAVGQVEGNAAFTQGLSLGLSLILIATYGLGMVSSLGSHKAEFTAVASHDGAAADDEEHWPMLTSLVTLGLVTVGVALVSEVFVGSVQEAASTLGLSPAVVGFIVVRLVGAAAEMTAAFSAARKDRLDLAVGIALGSAAQIALFVPPVLVLLSYVVGPAPMTLEFWPGAIVMMFLATMTATMLTAGGRAAWFVGVMILMVYAVFALTLYLMPPPL